MKKTTLSPLRLFMQSGMSVDLSFVNSTLTLTLKDASGATIATKTAEVAAGVKDVEVDGVSVVESGTAKIIGKYTKPTTGIPKSDLASDVQTSLGKADSALQEHQDLSGKQDKLVSGTNIKTINSQSILGSGNIEITGGGGIVLKGEKSGAELAGLTSSDVETGWTYLCTSSYSTFEANGLYSAVVDGNVLTWLKVSFIDLSLYVQKTRKVNGYTLESDVTINTTDIPDFEALTVSEAEAILNA